MSRLTAATLRASPDFEKLLVVDLETTRNLEEESWTATGAGSYYLTFTDGEPFKVELNGVAYTEYYTVAGCDSNASTWFYDLTNSRLYIHTVDGDSPATTIIGTPKYCVLPAFYIGLANRPVSLQRSRELLVDGKLDRWNDSSTLTRWTKTTTGTAALAREATEVYDSLSAYSAKLTVSAISSSVSIRQATFVRPGKQALLRLKYKCAGTTTPKIMVKDPFDTIWLKSDGTWAVSETKITLSNSTSWTEYSITFSGNTDYFYPYLNVWLIAETNGDECYFDYVELLRYYEPSFFLSYLAEGAVPSVRLSAGTLKDPSDELTIGTLTLADDGFFAQKFGIYKWDNRAVKCLLGVVGATYDELAPMFTGITRLPVLGDGTFKIDVSDSRQEFKNLLNLTFDATTYPNCEANWKEKPIPILFGHIHGLQPPQQDTSGRVYRISQTVFNGTTYALAAVDAVYKNGTLATETTDWTHNLTNGTITLLTGTAADVITCDATGYFSNFADWLYFVLTSVQGISEESVNYRSIIDMKSVRTSLTFARWYSEQVGIREALDAIKRSQNFYFFPRSDGTYYTRIITSTTPSDAPYFYNEDFQGFERWFDVDQCVATVTVQYTPYNDLDLESIAVNTESRPGWERGVKADLALEVLETTAADAATLAAMYGNILYGPPEMIRVTLPAPAVFLEPTDKIYISKSIVDADGTTRTIYTNTVFIVFNIEKNLNDLTATIEAVKYSGLYVW